MISNPVAELTETGYFANLKSLIENTSSQFNGCPVTMVAHSMGGLVSHHFLVNTVSQAWKDKYIHQYITLGAVWGGATRPLKALISGDQDNIFDLSSPLVLREDERSFPSGYWILPKPIGAIWNRSEVIVTTPNRTYTVFDVKDLLNDLKYDNAVAMYNAVMRSSIQGLPPPNVTTYCLYGSDIDTEKAFNYGDFPDGKPAVRHGKGDGTVNIESLEACQSWAGQQSYKVHVHPLNATDHMGIVRKEDVWQFIEKLVVN